MDKQEYFKKYYLENKEHLRQQIREWQKQNKVKERFRKTIYYRKYYKTMKRKALDKRVDYVDEGDLIFANYFG